MKILTIILLIYTTNIFSQIFVSPSQSLFSDYKAFRIGDAITVLIIEELQANNGAGTTENRNNTLNGGFNVGVSVAQTQGDLGLETENDFNADGRNSRNERIQSKLSARVEEIDANGNLKIAGTRTTKINGETQVITIKGTVRLVDVRPDNSIYSSSIMDLTLYIEGEGNITQTQEPGFITKFLRILF